MSDGILDDTRALADAALEAFRDDRVAAAALEGARARLDEPLRVAVAGMVKAGKSTLLNAVIGEEIAPTDAGECTRVVTWYRHGIAPRITLTTRDGAVRDLPVRRVDGRLELGLDGTPAEQVARLEVAWPSASLESVTLIDTPGIASLSSDVVARSTGFLLPDDSPSEADAVVYLMRHLHESDLRFLDAFRDHAVGSSSTVNAIAVLSRADEIGSGRLDAMLSAHEVAARYRRDPDLRRLVLGVVPVAGLLAQSSRTLRETEFNALRELAQLDRAERERMLLSVDRFTRPAPGISSSPELRRAVVGRFGIFGIRIAVSLLRGTAGRSSTELARELRGQSGLDELLSTVESLFGARAPLLKARAALAVVGAVVAAHPDDVRTAGIAARLERIEAGAHGLRELRLIAALRTSGLGLPPDHEREAEALLGARGDDALRRLGLPADAPREDAVERARELVARWRSRAADPRRDRAGAEACAALARTAEAQLARLGGSAPRSRGRLSLRREPLAVPRQE